jgi:hypothetical protein
MNTNETIPETTIKAPTTNPFDEPDHNTSKLPFVKDGDIINVNDVVKKEEKLFEFPQQDGTTRKVNRRLLTFKDGSQLVMSISLAWEISALRKEYGDKLGKIKVKKEGTGLATRWKAFPVL